MTNDPFGAAVGITVILITAALIGFLWRILSSKSEGGRRLRLVAVWSGAALTLAMMVSALGAVPALGTLAAIGVIIWIIRGFRKP